MYKKVGNKEKVVVACGDDNNTVSFLFLLVSLFACFNTEFACPRVSACFQLSLTLQWWKRRLIIIIIIKLKTSNESVAFTLPDGALQFDAVQRRIRSWKAAVKLFTVTVDRPKKKKTANRSTN